MTFPTISRNQQALQHFQTLSIQGSIIFPAKSNSFRIADQHPTSLVAQKHPVAQKTSSRMCQVSWNTTPRCRHQWAQITTPCAPGMGFDDCNTFQGGIMNMQPENKQIYPPGTCPWCDLGGWYNMNLIRMITKVKPGYHYGPSPRKGISTSCTIL
jgi:hypothetical protein